MLITILLHQINVCSVRRQIISRPIVCITEQQRPGEIEWLNFRDALDAPVQIMIDQSVKLNLDHAGFVAWIITMVSFATSQQWLPINPPLLLQMHPVQWHRL